MRNWVLIFILMLHYSLEGRAQSYSGQVSGNFIVYSIQSITITPLGGVIGLNTPNDFVNGVVANHYANVKIKSNANWIVSFSAQSTYFTGLSKMTSTDMPASVMGIRKNGAGSFSALSTQAKKLSEGNRGSSGNNFDFDIDVSFNPGFNYNGGVYTIGVVYTLTKK